MYNPFILGFDRQRGDLKIPLCHARNVFGKFPSELDSTKKNLEQRESKRDPNKVLNLDLGINIKEWFRDKPNANLKGFVFEFFSDWHRDYDAEFDIKIEPLINRNNPALVKDVLSSNKYLLEDIFNFDLRECINKHQIIRKDILNSIEKDEKGSESPLLEKAIKRLERKCNDKNHKKKELENILNKLKIKKILLNLLADTDCCPKSMQTYPINIYADEVANALAEIAKLSNFRDIKLLDYVSGNGIEMDYVPRDSSYLVLGRYFGDCTSDQRRFQTDAQTENIYWTVFSWILDRNYQIMRVFVDGSAILKIHLLPLYFNPSEYGESPFFFLCVDAIEAAPSVNELPSNIQSDELFQSINDGILKLADRMGIEVVLSERFSNTAWVRSELAKYSEIFLDTQKIVKIDDLEDVFECANLLCSKFMSKDVGQIFMEVQAKNTHLMPDTPIGLKGACKSFAVLRGNSYTGIPMQQLFGV